MKKLFLSMLLLSSLSWTQAQENSAFILSNRQAIGKNLKNGNNVEGTSNLFAAPIEAVNTGNGNQAVVLLKYAPKYRNRGTIVGFDPAASRALWQKDVNMDKEQVLLNGGTAIITLNRVNSILSPTDGAARPLGTIQISYISPQQDVCIGYPAKALTISDDLQGLSLKDGNVLWTRKLKHRFGWSSVTPINDTTVLIVADNIHSVNLKTGAGWDYTAVTGNDDYTSSYNQPLEARFQTPFGMKPAAEENMVYGLVSEPIIRNGRIYIATAQNLICLSEDGKEIWKSALPENLTSNSSIFSHGENIAVVNNGYAYLKGQKMLYGLPYVAYFSQKDGREIYVQKLEKNVITDHSAEGDILRLLSYNRLSTIDLVTGQAAVSTKPETKDYAQLSSFAHIPLYQENGGNYTRIIENRNNIFIITDKGDLLTYHPDTQTTEILPGSKLYSETFRTGELTCISQGKQSVILDQEGNPTAQIQLGADCFVGDDMVFCVSNNILYCIKLSDLN